MARKTRRSGEKNDGKDLDNSIFLPNDMDKFIEDLSNNSPHEDQFKEMEKENE